MTAPAIPHERRVVLERTPYIDVPGNGVDFFAFDEQLYALYGG